MDLSKKNTVLVTCAPGLVDSLLSELAGLGFDAVSSHRAGVEIKATMEECWMLNLNLRTGFNVLYLLKYFQCEDPDRLYNEVYEIAWDDIIPTDEYVSVVSRVDTPSIDNTMFPSLKTKDAVVDKISAVEDSRPDAGPEKKGIVLHLYWKDKRCWLYLNTSGRKLADRGYRKMPHSAPLQETLAAGIIFATGYGGQMPFVVPMCGSGTLAIEAALIALNKAPGLLRSNYGFMHIKNFSKKPWNELRKHTLGLAKKSVDFPIIATDVDPKAIKAAKQNAKTAGVDHLIDFRVCDFRKTEIPPAKKGIVICNPAYGKRIGEKKKLEKTYSSIGDFYKQKCPGYTGYIFTGNLELAKKVGLKAKSRTIFYNGDIECRLLEYPLYKGSKES